MKNGYLEAQQFDDRVNELLRDSPIEKRNCIEWLKFARTVATTAYILQKEAEHAVRRLYNERK